MERTQDARGYYSSRWRMATRYAVGDRAVVEQSERVAANTFQTLPDKTTYYRNVDSTMDEEIGENCYIIDRPAGKSPAPNPEAPDCRGMYWISNII